jgi:hypothetical protein
MIKSKQSKQANKQTSNKKTSKIVLKQPAKTSKAS